SKAYDVFTYAVPCIVIVGRSPITVEEKKSLELYRNNLRDVIVITFDELLAKLKALHEFLAKKP
ncbi:Shedu anti-phage system protein SduA domain-containing protein, partial [Mesorhizobium sp.]